MQVFSKFDIKEAYWHVRLDTQSNEYCTMITSFGRYRWAGLQVSSETFQRKLNEALEGLDGIFPVADDIIIAGQGENNVEAREDNHKKIEVLEQCCKERNIVLNDEKNVTGLEEICSMDILSLQRV